MFVLQKKLQVYIYNLAKVYIIIIISLIERLKIRSIEVKLETLSGLVGKEAGVEVIDETWETTRGEEQGEKFAG